MHTQNTTILVNMDTNQQWRGTQTELIKLTAQKMYASPSLASVITDLHSDSFKSVDITEVDGKPVVNAQDNLLCLKS